MWDISTEYLQEGETIEYVDRPSLMSFGIFLAFIWAGFMLLALIMASFAFRGLGGTGASAILVYVLVGFPAVFVILRRVSTRYAITNRGLIRRTGIIMNNLKSVSFVHITAIEAKETLAGKLFGHGNLFIDTSGSGRAIEERWRWVKGAHSVKKLIEKHLPLGK